MESYESYDSLLPDIELETENIPYKLPIKPIELSLCNTEYIVENDRPVILLFTRDKDLNDYIIPVYGFKPYFYISKNDLSVYESLGYLKDLEYSFTDFYGYNSSDKLVKICTKIPSEVEIYRNVTNPATKRKIKTWEADILFPLRFLIDNNIRTGLYYVPIPKNDLGDKSIDYSKYIIPRDVPSIYRKLYIDIETYSYKIPDTKEFNDPIIVIGTFDSFSKRFVIFTTKGTDEDLSNYLTKKSEVQLIICKNEKILLSKFKEYIKTINPDLFLSFSDFDWIYIFNRMKKLKISINDISRVNVCSVTPHRVKIHGIQFLDLQTLYYEKFLRGSKWETLHEIAHRELNMEKLYREESVYDNWNNDHVRVLARNIRDVEIIYRLDSEKDLITHFESIRRTVGCNLSDTLYKTRIADIAYLRMCHNKIALPTRTFMKKVEYEGAVVYPVVPGIYKNIAVFDWSSMYPNIIIAFNISFETQTIRDFGDLTYNIDDKYFFFKEPEGMTPKLLKELMPLRDPFKKLLKDPNITSQEKSYYKAVSDGIKSVINSIYGVFGNAGDQDTIKSFRLYSPNIASAITYIGRQLELEGIIPICQELGLEVIYFDTDSVFVKMKSSNKEDCIALEKILNNKIKDFIQKRWNVDPKPLNISFDKMFDTLIMLSKKRYAGKEIDGNIDVKGLEIVRRNASEVSSEIQEKFSNAIFDNKSREEMIQMIRDFVRSFKDRPIEQIGIPQNLTKDLDNYKVQSSHLKAFNFSRDVIGLHLVQGKRFWTIYVKDIPDHLKTIAQEKGYKDPKMIAWDRDNQLPDTLLNYIDYDLMLEKTVRDKVDDFMKLTNIDWYTDILQIKDPVLEKSYQMWLKRLKKHKIDLILPQDVFDKLYKNKFRCDQSLCPCNNFIKSKLCKYSELK